MASVLRSRILLISLEVQIRERGYSESATQNFQRSLFIALLFSTNSTTITIYAPLPKKPFYNDAKLAEVKDRTKHTPRRIAK